MIGQDTSKDSEMGRDPLLLDGEAGEQDEVPEQSRWSVGPTAQENVQFGDWGF